MSDVLDRPNRIQSSLQLKNRENGTHGPEDPDIRAGLPGVKRLMDQFELHSDAENGTDIQAIKWLR